MVYCEWKPDELIEGFLGLDVGSSTKTTNKSHTENIRDTLNENINKTLMSTKTGMSSVVDASQMIDLDFEECDKAFAPIYLEMVKGANDGKKDCIAAVAPNTEAMKTCGDVYKIGKSEDITPCMADNLSQELTMTFDASMSISAKDTEEVQKNLRESLDTAKIDEEDALGSAAKELAKSGGGVKIGSSSDTTEDHTTINKTTIKNRVVNIVDKNFITEMSTKMAGNQTIKAKGGKLSFITQTMSLDLVASMTSENEKFKSLMEDIEKVEKHVEEKKVKGLTDAIETGGDVLKTGITETGGVANNAIDTGGDVAETGIETGGDVAKSGMLTVMLPFIIGFFVVAIVFGLILWKSGVLKTAADTGATVVKAKAGVV